MTPLQQRRAAVSAIIEDCKRHLEARVDERWDMIVRTGDALLKHRTLTHEQVVKIADPVRAQIAAIEMAMNCMS